MSGQWKIPWVGSTGDPGQRSGVWEAAGQTRSRGVSAGAGRSGPAGAKETETWAGPGGRAAGRLGRVLPRAPPRWPPQPPPLRRKPPPRLGPRVRPEETAEAETTEGRTVPGRWAQLL